MSVATKYLFPCGEGVGELAPGFHAVEHLFLAEQAVVQRFYHACFIHVLADKDQFLTHIAEGLLPFFHDVTTVFAVIRPIGFGDGLPEHACRGIVGNTASLAPLPGKLRAGGQPKKKPLERNNPSPNQSA